MHYNHRKEKEKLLSADTPDQYIDYSFRSRISGRAKSVITREWLARTGYTINDIQDARNRHPQWKKIKAKGSYERTMKRLRDHDYRVNGQKVVWDREKVSRFYDLNKEGLADYELAREFRTTLPSVNHIRRKLLYAGRILQLSGHPNPGKAKILDLAMTAEKTLKLKLQMITGSASAGELPMKNPQKAYGRKPARQTRSRVRG